MSADAEDSQARMRCTLLREILASLARARGLLPLWRYLSDISAFTLSANIKRAVGEDFVIV